MPSGMYTSLRHRELRDLRFGVILMFTTMFAAFY